MALSWIFVSKLQIPSTKLQINHKSQAPNYKFTRHQTLAGKSHIPILNDQSALGRPGQVIVEIFVCWSLVRRNPAYVGVEGGLEFV